MVLKHTGTPLPVRPSWSGRHGAVPARARSAAEQPPRTDDAGAVLTEDVVQAWSLLRTYFARAQAAEIDALADRLNAALVAEIPELERMRADLDASTRSLLASFFSAAAQGPESEIVIDAAVMDLARTLAIRTGDLGVLFRAYRVGQRLAWREFNAILTAEVADPELRLAAMNFLLERLGAEIERVVDASITVFTAERDQWLGGTLARKAELVDALVRGVPVDVDECTRVLRHRLHPGQVAILLWCGESGDGSAALERLEKLARDIASVLGAATPLTLPEGARLLSVWLNAGSDPDVEVLRATVERAGRGIHLALGASAPGPAGFRNSHRQAVLARRVALHAEVPATITPYRAIAAFSPFLADPESLADLVATELADLAARDDNSARLRETTLAYLRSGGSARDAALRLGVHKNTVLYRMRLIEDALGHRLSERRLPLEVALEMVEWLGPKVLP